MTDEEEGEGRSRPENSFRTELGLELYRQHTLLSVLAARMRESADALDRGVRLSPARVQRALDAHRRFLIEVHHEDERRLASALAGVTDPSVRHALTECAQEHPLEAKFQHDASQLVREGSLRDQRTARRLARLFREEAGRIEAHHAREEEAIYRHLEAILPAGTLARLLRAVRVFDNERITAEIALSSWASELHPSSD